MAGAVLPALDAEVRSRGFAVVDLPDFFDPLALRAMFDRLEVPAERGFFASCNDAERRIARDVDLALKHAVAPLARTFLPGQVPFLASFVSKGALHGGPMDFHQDLTYVDERLHRTTMIWIPLVDVDERSGALEIVPGSHRWSSKLRAGGTGPLPTADLQAELREMAETVPARVGTAVLFDNAVIHGSAPNQAAHVRPAAAVAFAPRGVELLHVHRDEGAPAAAFCVDEAFFTTQTFRARPVGYREIPLWGDLLTPADLCAAVRRIEGGRPRSGEPRPGTSNPSVTRWRQAAAWARRAATRSQRGT